MAFQDFDLLNERREIEKKRRRKRIMIFAIVLCIVVIGAAVAVVIVQKKDDDDSKPGKTSPDDTSKTSKEDKPAHKTHQDKDNADVTKSSKMVTTMCASTDFKATCESNLGKFVKANPSETQQPKDLIKAAFSIVSSELKKAMNDSSKFKLDTPKKKEAFEVCEKVIGDALQELNSSTNTVGEKDIGALDSQKGDLNNWLSAVMSYQHTCIDAIPEGEAKEEIKKALQTSRELTSNSLAIVSQMSSILSSFPKPKRLLLSESRQRTLLEEKFPVWMSIAERRLLKINPPKQKPDVTVAKDGSGNFKTINDALAKLPQNHQGRYKF